MRINWNRWTRKIHNWGAIGIALPILLVIGSGLLLQVKKQVPWVQPGTMRGSTETPALSLEEILAATRSVPRAGIRTWADVDRVDVRPGQGVAKVRGTNRWEVQIDHATGEILQVAYRRSDLIESIHDGSFFHDKAKLWVFLPSAVALFVLWLTGMHLFFLPRVVRRRKRSKPRASPSATLQKKTA
jgi:hypothetical protein